LPRAVVALLTAFPASSVGFHLGWQAAARSGWAAACRTQPAVGFPFRAVSPYETQPRHHPPVRVMQRCARARACVCLCPLADATERPLLFAVWLAVGTLSRCKTEGRQGGLALARAREGTAPRQNAAAPKNAVRCVTGNLLCYSPARLFPSIPGPSPQPSACRTLRTIRTP